MNTKRILLLLPISAVLFGCQSSNEKTSSTAPATNYLDLSAQGQQNQVKQYWTIKKRVEPQYPLAAAQKIFQVVLN